MIIGLSGPEPLFTRKWLNDKALTMLDIGYYSFYEDCSEIFTPFLAKFGFFEIEQIGQDDDYTKHYRSEYWVLEISMLFSFPYIGVGFLFLNLMMETAWPRILRTMIPVDGKAVTNFYNQFSKDNDLTDYRNQMIFEVEILNRFYKKVLMGEITFKDYQIFLDKMEPEKPESPN